MLLPTPTALPLSGSTRQNWLAGKVSSKWDQYCATALSCSRKVGPSARTIPLLSSQNRSFSWAVTTVYADILQLLGISAVGAFWENPVVVTVSFGLGHRTRSMGRRFFAVSGGGLDHGALPAIRFTYTSTPIPTIPTTEPMTIHLLCPAITPTGTMLMP